MSVAPHQTAPARGDEEGRPGGGGAPRPLFELAAIDLTQRTLGRDEIAKLKLVVEVAREVWGNN